MYPGQASLPALPIYHYTIAANQNTWLGCLTLRVTPWSHLHAVFDKNLVHTYTDSTEKLLGDLPGVFTMLWDWRNRTAIPVHHVRANARVSASMALATVVRLGYLWQCRAPLEVPILLGPTIDILLYHTPGDMYNRDRLPELETFA